MMQTQNKRNPLVSVVMPACNAATWIMDAIRSVQAQTMEDWELLIIDDGSRDETVRLAHSAAGSDPRIRVYENRENQGVARVRNQGINLSRGRYVAFLDSDDIWLPDKLERQLAIFCAKQTDLVCCSYGFLDSRGKLQDRYSVPQKITLELLLQNNVIGCSTVMMTRETAASCRFDSEFYHEDYVLWLQLLRAGKTIRGLTEVQVYCRKHSGSRTNNKFLAAYHRWKVYRQFMNFSVARSMGYMLHYGITGLLKYTQF